MISFPSQGKGGPSEVPFNFKGDKGGPLVFLLISGFLRVPFQFHGVCGRACVGSCLESCQFRKDFGGILWISTQFQVGVLWSSSQFRSLENLLVSIQFHSWIPWSAFRFQKVSISKEWDPFDFLQGGCPLKCLSIAHSYVL